MIVGDQTGNSSFTYDGKHIGESYDKVDNCRRFKWVCNIRGCVCIDVPAQLNNSAMYEKC